MIMFLINKNQRVLLATHTQVRMCLTLTTNSINISKFFIIKTEFPIKSIVITEWFRQSVK